MYRHTAGCQGDILRRRVQALIRLALKRYSEAPETPPTENFAEIDLVDDPGVIGAVRLVSEHHAARTPEPDADSVNVGIRPDPALRRSQHRLIDGTLSCSISTPERPGMVIWLTRSLGREMTGYSETIMP